MKNTSTQIWKRSDSMTGTSDSDVFLCGDVCIKEYPDLSFSTIKKYHGLQNGFSDYERVLLQRWTFQWLDFSSICINILELWNDIQVVDSGEYNRDIVRTKVPFIPWNCAEELGFNLQFNDVTSNDVFKQIKTDLHNRWISFFYNFQWRTISSFSIIYNLRFRVSNNILHITITDLAPSIQDYVDHFSQKAFSVV